MWLAAGIVLGVLIGVCCGAGTNTPALLATREATQSKIPMLGYTVPYAIGNMLIIAWGPVIVNVIPELKVNLWNGFPSHSRLIRRSRCF